LEGLALAWTLSELASVLGVGLEGDGSRRVVRPVPAGTADPEGVTFADSDKYLAKALSAPIGAVIVRPGAETGDVPKLVTAQPRLAFGALLGLAQRRWPVQPGVHPTAVVADGANVAKDASVGPYCVVSEGAEVAAGAVLRAFVFVGPGCRVGARSVLEPHSVLLQDVKIGADCRVLPGSVLGADGFGFAWDGERHAKVPQAGGVVVGDRVEIGANACVDRATCGETEIAEGVKLDNMVQVAHNVKIGRHTVVASQTGFSG
jgi:UDP-3-O-[3-hydroxymyristoyl] glucosamine N-acyltransferase